VFRVQGAGCRVQDDIAREIVDALHVPLGLSEKASIVVTGTSNVEAYTAYLRGRHHFARIGPENFDKTVELMNQAIELDPSYAAPHGILASAYSIAALWLPRNIALPLAKASFERALELDPKLAIALLTKARYLTITEWDWIGWERGTISSVGSPMGANRPSEPSPTPRST
jgi:hypothetical protein